MGWEEGEGKKGEQMTCREKKEEESKKKVKKRKTEEKDA